MVNTSKKYRYLGFQPVRLVTPILGLVCACRVHILRLKYSSNDQIYIDIITVIRMQMANFFQPLRLVTPILGLVCTCTVQ